MASIKTHLTLLDGLLAYYKLDGNANDAHTNALHGTPEGTPTWAANCKLRQGLQLNGSSQCVSLGLSSLLCPGNITLSCWAYVDSTGGAYQAMINKRYYAPGGGYTVISYIFTIYLPTNLITTIVSSGDSAPYWHQIDYSAGSGIRNSWHHYAMTYDGSVLAVYLDGILRQTLTGCLGPIKERPTIATLIGARTGDSGEPSRSDYFKGYIDEVLISGRAFTPAEVLDLYHTGYPLRYEEVVVGVGDIMEGIQNLGQLEPGCVDDFEGVPGSHEIAMTWVNPDLPGLVGVVIRRSEVTYPATPVDGVQVYDDIGEEYTDEDLDPTKTYYYSAFAYITGPVYSAAASGSWQPLVAPPVTDFEGVPGLHQISLSWVNPTYVNFDEVMIRWSNTVYPTTPLEGDLVYQGDDESVIDTALDPTKTYYYSIFAFDKYGVYSTSQTGNWVPLEQAQVTGAEATSPTVVQVTYDMEMRHSDPDGPYDSLNEANYVFTGDDLIVAYSVALYQTDPTIVNVTLTHEMTDAAPYLLTVNNVRDLAHDLTLRDNTESFTGVGTVPRVTGATIRPGYKVRITFSIAMKNDAALLKETNYDFTDGLEASLVEYVDSTHVDVSVGEMLIDHLYTVTVSNVHSLYGSHIASPPNNQAEFTGTGISPTVAEAATQTSVNRVVVDYSENMRVAEATTTMNYIVDPAMEITTVTQLTATRYQIHFVEPLTVGILYTITITGVHDLVGNIIDPDYDTASFTGMDVSPYLYVYPASESVDLPARTLIRIQAVDQELSFTGVDPATWNVSITKDHITRVVMKDGVFDDGLFYGGVTGAADDPNDGMLLRFRPKHGHWEGGSAYTINANIADMEAWTTYATWTLGFNPMELDFFEDNPIACGSDTKVAYPGSTFATSYPACEQLRQIFMRACTHSVDPIVQARTLQVTACQPAIRPIVAPRIDLAIVEATRLGDRVNSIELQTLLAKSMRIITEARDEVETIVGATIIRPFDECLRSGDAALVTGTVASLVILATCV